LSLRRNKDIKTSFTTNINTENTHHFATIQNTKLALIYNAAGKDLPFFLLIATRKKSKYQTSSTARR
jgi:hypothetical protein